MSWLFFKNSIEHALNCKFGGLIEVRHDEVANERHALAKMVFGKNKIEHEPQIYRDDLPPQDLNKNNQTKHLNVNANIVETDTHDEIEIEEGKNITILKPHNRNRGDKSILGFWSRGIECIFDIRIMDLECKSYIGQNPQKVLNRIERAKCTKYKQVLQDQNKDFTPLVYSIDGMPGYQTKLAEKRMAALLAATLNRDYSEMAFYVRARMTISIVRCNTILLRSTRVKKPRKLRDADRATAIDMGISLRDY